MERRSVEVVHLVRIHVSANVEIALTLHFSSFLMAPLRDLGPRLNRFCQAADSGHLEESADTGARGHLPRGYIVSSWWVLKQFAPTLPSESMVGTF